MRWAGLSCEGLALALAEATSQYDSLLIYPAASSAELDRLRKAVRVFNPELSIYVLPDWETLPYDRFSPLRQIISERILNLNKIANASCGLILTTLRTCLQRLPPKSWITESAFILEVGCIYPRSDLLLRLSELGYVRRSLVSELGDMAVRGSVIDIYLIGQKVPVRLDFFDDSLESIRYFSADDQRSLKSIESVTVLPAREFPLTEEAVVRFKKNWRLQFGVKNLENSIYDGISRGIYSAGVEYYLPFFFSGLPSLIDYLSSDPVIICNHNYDERAGEIKGSYHDRFSSLQSLGERPLLSPDELLLDWKKLLESGRVKKQIDLYSYPKNDKVQAVDFSKKIKKNLNLLFKNNHSESVDFLLDYLEKKDSKIIFVVSSNGRFSTLCELFKDRNIVLEKFNSWKGIIRSASPIGVIFGELEEGFDIIDPSIKVIAEDDIFEQSKPTKKRKAKSDKTRENLESLIQNLTELESGDAVVHEDYGVGRYAGLEILNTGGVPEEFLKIIYADGDKLYIPVRNIDLVNRYSGAGSGEAPLHKLGSGQWEKVCRKAKSRITDVAAEILEIYAKREMQSGRIISANDDSYSVFSDQFDYEETVDQESAIQEVINDLQSGKPMDRLICGDVGFGKTEVAMRAIFLAVNSGYQVAVLVPTTLLARQHYETFCTRFSGWPINIAKLSRLQSRTVASDVRNDIAVGAVDVVVGTQKLLNSELNFKKLGLLIIDEEHRFGVTQKEKIKSIKGDVHILTLTATPIPRTLNMALSGIRDLSLMASPPKNRVAIKTFVSQYSEEIVQEAVRRELERGGQVYFIHNEVKTISRVENQLREIVPEARIGVTHGQLSEKELERRMSDFYRGEANLLLSTTIVESGLDLPNANTIIINRADKMGLAQLYQLRGRVGRSNHMAYAHLFVPDKQSMSRDAKRRLDAIESLDELGMGYLLANHDLEIRGAGAILGDEQSGEIEEMGFFLFNEMLSRTVNTLTRERDSDNLAAPSTGRVDIDLHIPALLPEDYLPDVHTRLILYKRISTVEDYASLDRLREEIIDRYGFFGDEVQNLFSISKAKLGMKKIGVKKIDLGTRGGRLEFYPETPVSPSKILNLLESSVDYKMRDPQTLLISKLLPEGNDRLKELEFISNTLDLTQ